MSKDNELLKAYAEAEGLPITGLVIIQGQPYVNSTGLHAKLNKLLEEKGFEVKQFETGYDPFTQQSADKLEELRIRYRCKLVLFDKKSFMEALKSQPNLDANGIEKLKEAFTYEYSADGYASALTCEGIAYEYVCVERDERGRCKRRERGRVLLDNVAMMAERRAINRTLRMAVGVGLTSIEEIPNIEEAETVEPKATINQKQLIQKILRSEVFTEDERRRIMKKVPSLTVREASQLIEELKKTHDERKKEQNGKA